MHNLKAHEILCFSCVAQVDVCTMNGTETVCCSICGNMVSLVEAQDDCFVFVVASAMATSALPSYAPHTYRFMPRLSGRDPLATKVFMISSHRAKKMTKAA